jgi:hypothetical protein
MFGNTTGWTISAVIALLGFLGGYQLLLVAQPTPPTGWVARAVLPLQLGDNAKGILDMPMDDLKDDAGDLYRQAIADYQNHKTEYEELQKTRDFDDTTVAQINQMAGMNDLVQAARCPVMNLFKSKPDELVGYTTTVPELQDLQEIARTAENVIALAKYDKRYDIAHKYANALAALGYHLYVERDAYLELSAAENYLGTGAASMLSVAQAEHGDTRDADKFMNFDVARRDEFDNRIDPVIKVISGQSQADIGAHAGDMFQLAADPQADRVWRVEAIRKIGRLQFNAENRADQVKAPKFLKKLAADASLDPVIRAAATKARDMTSYDNQSQR